VTLFAPEQAALLDFSQVRFLDKELFTDLAAGDSREVDVLAEVRTRDGGPPRLILIHVEIQRERQEDFAQRMLRYFLMIRLRFPDHAILPLALVSYPTAQGIAVASATVAVAGFTTLVYNYIEISLPSLDPHVYLEAPQPLAVGLAPLMRVPRRGKRDRLYEECLRRLSALEQAGALDPARLFILHNLLRTYLDLTPTERHRLLRRLDEEGATIVKTTELTWADRTRTEGRTEAILVVLRDKFGAVPPDLTQRIRRTTDPADLDALLICAVHATTLADF